MWANRIGASGAIGERIHPPAVGTARHVIGCLPDYAPEVNPVEYI
jgi:hypothetical protein